MNKVCEGNEQNATQGFRSDFAKMFGILQVLRYTEQRTYPLSADELRNSLRVSLSPSEDNLNGHSVNMSTMSTAVDLPTQISVMSSKLDLLTTMLPANIIRTH